LAALVIWVLGLVRPSWGTKPLILLGCAIIFAVVIFRVSEVDEIRSGIREAVENNSTLRGNELNFATNVVAAKIADKGELKKDLKSIPKEVVKAALGKDEAKSAPVLKQGPILADIPEAKAEDGAGDLRVESHKRAAEDKPIWPVVLAAAA